MSKESPGTRMTALGSLALLLLLQVTPARADIWGYVDAERMPHFASSRLDERYELLLRDNDAVEPFQRIQAAGPPRKELAETARARPDVPVLVEAVTPAPVAVSPRLQSIFEQSRHYRAISPLLLEASRTHGIDYALLQALIATESGFNTHAVSPKGAVGLMQLIPPTAARYGVTAGKNSTIARKLTDPKTNIKAGARYLADLIRMFPGRLELALAAYNAGEGAVQRAGNRIPNYPETRNYVKTVMQLYTGLAPPSLQTPGGRVRVELAGGPAARGKLPAPVESPPRGLRADTSRDQDL